MRPLLAVILLVGFVTAAPVPKAFKKKDDSVLIIGTWKPAAEGATCWYKFNADGTMRTWHTPESGPPLDWEYTLDPTANPKRVKLTRTTAPTESYNGSYELDGDQLKIAFSDGVLNHWPYCQTRDTSAK